MRLQFTLLSSTAALAISLSALADSPPNISTDINWTDSGGAFDPDNGIFNASFSGVTDTEIAYNNARRAEEIELGLTANCYGDLDLPAQSEWDAKSDSLKGLFIVNAERVARSGMCGTNSLVLGLPFEAAEQHVIDVAKNYADVLVANDAFQHTHPVDGSSPSDRLNNDSFIGNCNEFLSQVENLAAFWTSGSNNPLVVERSIYNFIYDDSSSQWGHRTAALLQDKNLAGNPWGYTNNNNDTADEGYVGFGVTSAQDYMLPGYFGTVVVMNMFDPIQESSTCDYDIGEASPTGHFELVYPTISSGDRFGYAVSIDGDYAVAGARLDDINGYSNNGSAQVFMRNGPTDWVHVTTLEGTSDATSDNDKFGHSVAISGDTIAVGAENDDDVAFKAGLVYIFDRNEGGVDNWGLVKTISAFSTQSRDNFGRALDIDGDSLIVGAHLADPAGNKSGSAYIFSRNEGGTNNWGEVSVLDPIDGAAGDLFGLAVGIHGDFAVVGAMRDDDGGADSGSAYLFNRTQGGVDNWGLEKKITSLDTVAADQFGYSVAISEGTVVIGARNADDATTARDQIGAVYTFEKDEGGLSNWGQQQRILASNGVAGDRFGASVAISGDRLLVGATHADDSGTDAGKAYLFVRTGLAWTEQAEISNSTVSTRDYYGVDVDLDGQVGLVGAWLDNRPSNNSGGAFIQYLPD